MLRHTVPIVSNRIKNWCRSTHFSEKSYVPNKRLNAPSEKRYNRLWRPVSCRKNRAHIIGVVVSEMNSDTTMATLSTTANSRKSRPTMPPIIKMGINTATSDALMEMTVKPISRATLIHAAYGAIPDSMCRAMFSITTMASSTTNPVQMVSAIKDKLSRLQLQRYITPKWLIRKDGTAPLG